MLTQMAGITRKLLLLSVAFGLFCIAAFGQMNTAEIAGQVKDPTGAVIAGAAVEATHIATQQKFTATANDSGLFLLPQLPLGEYTLTVSAMGFKQAVQEHVVALIRNEEPPLSWDSVRERKNR